MKEIGLEQWEPSPGDPRQMQYAGQRAAQEVFEELKHRLESMGYLPDEYFLMDREWENGRKIPKGADIFCTTDYGSSEGVYLDVYLKWYENNRPVKMIDMFAVGHTAIVKLLCENRLMKTIIDHYGESVPTHPYDADHFVAEIEVNPSGTFYGWIFKFMGGIKILAPKECVEEMKRISRLFL